MPTLLQHGGLHVAIIMDGNGRWRSRARCPHAGHRAGVVPCDARSKPHHFTHSMLTLYASPRTTEAPDPGSARAHATIRHYLRKEVTAGIEQGVAHRDHRKACRLPAHVRDAIESAEAMTRHGMVLTLRLQSDIRRATRSFSPISAPRSEGSRAPERDVDLLIRTGGDQSLSDFCCGNARKPSSTSLTETAWPDFDSEAPRGRVSDIPPTQRRFGGLEIVQATR